MAAVSSQRTYDFESREGVRAYELECVSRKDLQALGHAYGYHGDGKTTSSELFARALKREKLECMTRRALVALAKFLAIEANQGNAVIIEKILFYVAGAAKQALLATPIKPVTDVPVGSSYVCWGLVRSYTARKDTETVHEVPLKNGDIKEEQSERTQSGDFAAIRAIDAACAEQSPCRLLPE